MKNIIKYWPVIIVPLVLLGLMDALYLTIEHYQNVIPPCTINHILGDCGKVLKSEYSAVFGIPLALIGVFHYSLFSIVLILSLILNKRSTKFIALILSLTGFLGSLYFVYLQLFVIHAICIFCMLSALISTLLFILIQTAFSFERKLLLIYIFGYFYKHAAKYFLFKIDPETIHTFMVHTGELLGKLNFVKPYRNLVLEQKVVGIKFNSPIGLAAGFDYEARLTQILPAIGFGFETVGTITNNPYVGNPKPMLGRLPKSKSLMVNKGFKNLGAIQTIKKLEKLNFVFPLGISIGRTNTKNLVTQKQSVKDIVKTFKLFEKSKVKHSYYELNISCPNLYGNISFYPSKNLNELLNTIDKLKIKRPIFIKMPIEKTNSETLAMLKVIAKHKIAGVVFGNLQKNREHPSLNPNEVAQFSVGYFSGKPTFDRSNELISLCYKHFKNRFVIIGCGGVFNTQDAYEKIKRGATLVQLITGMIFEGPQLISQINLELIELLKKDGFSHISQAIGTKH